MFCKKNKKYSNIVFSLDEENNVYNIVYTENVIEDKQIKFERKEIQKSVDCVHKILERILQ